MAVRWTPAHTLGACGSGASSHDASRVRPVRRKAFRNLVYEPFSAFGHQAQRPSGDLEAAASASHRSFSLASNNWRIWDKPRVFAAAVHLRHQCIHAGACTNKPSECWVLTEGCLVFQILPAQLFVVLGLHRIQGRLGVKQQLHRIIRLDAKPGVV